MILECDNAAVVQELHNSVKIKSAILLIIAEIKSLLVTLPGFKVCKINRSGNIVAHKLAAFRFREWSPGVVLNLIPPCVVESVQLDCNRLCNTTLLDK